MGNYFYSYSENAFYPKLLIAEYERAGTLPEDLVEVEDDVYQVFSAEKTPDGKTRVPGLNGMPEWGDVPPLTHTELIASAEKKKAQLISDATAFIAPLQDAVDLDIETADEITLLSEWKKYRVALSRIDINSAPEITWPELPA